MKIEYLPPEKEDEILNETLKQAQKEEALGCLLMGLFMLIMLFTFLAMLPVLLIILGAIITCTALYLAYKIWLERHVLNFIQKHNLRRK